MTPPLKRLPLSIVAVIGAWLGFSNPALHFPPLVLLFPAGICGQALLASGKKNAFYWGFFTGAAAVAGCLYWVAYPIHYYGYLPWLLAAPCPVLIGLIVGLYTGLFAVFAHVAGKRLSWPWFGLFCGPAWVLLYEYAKGMPLFEFPWLLLPAAFSPWPLFLQAASLVGVYGVSALLAMAGCWLGAAWVRYLEKRRLAALPLVPALAIVAALLAFGAVRFHDPITVDATAKMGIVQGNIDQSQKWNKEYQMGTVRRYMLHTGKLAKQAAFDVVIWPETSMPFYFQEKNDMSAALKRFAKDTATPLLFGAPGYGQNQEKGSEDLYNRAYLVDNQGMIDSWYDKEHLVPFGEYVPYQDFLPFIRHLTASIGDFSPGERTAPLRSGDLAMGMLICYESIFPRIAQKRVAAGANVLVNISNDAWFGRTSAPRQHLELTVLRAIELNRYIVRSTNTGISAFVDPKGRILEQSPLFETVAMGLDVGLLSKTTVFFGIRDYVLPAMGILAVALFVLALARPVRPGEPQPETKA